MDYQKYLRELYEEKKRLDRIIAHLEELADRRGAPTPPLERRRGRKPGMSSEEKTAISNRMREYWANRRRQKQPPPADESSAASA